MSKQKKYLKSDTYLLNCIRDVLRLSPLPDTEESYVVTNSNYFYIGGIGTGNYHANSSEFPDKGLGPYMLRII